MKDGQITIEDIQEELASRKAWRLHQAAKLRQSLKIVRAGTIAYGDRGLYSILLKGMRKTRWCSKNRCCPRQLRKEVNDLREKYSRDPRVPQSEYYSFCGLEDALAEEKHQGLELACLLEACIQFC